ncbi:MAG: M12 family metallo-peptidase [Ignavibacteriaceae bacterium]|jgi:Developmentally Regulated MAPK Interacting Protein.|nr:MAG: peptidase S8/S53 subtilisin kexin sedolisin [Chlorobi bacterium OLB4]MBW7854763.1 choice-of-anchor J domain-containing protein [Ignavibacteria bacterium]MEB2329932.1 M12 family metallo-peptidase [Ignavibacteriaceae bacterium]
MKKLIRIYLPVIALVLIAFIITFFFDGTGNPESLIAKNESLSLWSFIEEQQINLRGERRILPTVYSVANVNFSDLVSVLNRAPAERTEEAKNSPLIFELPKPDGTFERFSVVSYQIMEPELAKKFPEIRTFIIKGIDDPYAVGTIDHTPHGFHGMVRSPHGDYFIDPYSTNETSNYITYYTANFTKASDFVCNLVEGDNSVKNSNPLMHLVTGEQLRTYRLACAATGEYTIFHGGTVPLGMAAITTTVNRVNGIYHTDVALRMVLVANNDQLVYTNPSTDPYTNNNGGAMLGENQSNIDNVIGNSNYDIGHVFSTGGGGVAWLGSVCISGQKARGVTGSSQPIGDPFDVDYVAHEMGHQYSGNHTQNNNCNRNGSTAWEPGSASTIMGYAGVCPPNLQNNSDPYFHSGSYSEMSNFTQTGAGNSCAQTTATGNLPPIVTVPTGGFTIPVSTPFKLTGSATDPNSDPVTYCWEEFDLGPAGNPNNPSGNAPIFRSWLPSTSPTRYFPRLQDLLNNTTVLGELLPTYTRSLSFRLTVRDNNPQAGGVNFGLIQFSVTSTAGPFLVVSPNTNVTWNASDPQTITWAVANTNASPVNVSNVNIKLSTDGGLTYPLTLAANTANDGSEVVNLPNISTNQARVMVEAVDNIFFDISNVNFTISSGPPPQTGFPESFENSNFPPAGWGKLNPDNGTGWNRQTVGTSPIPGWTGGVITAPPGGENAVAFCTWNTGGTNSNDQWIYTPQISDFTSADSITFWMKRSFSEYSDKVEVRLSNTTPTVGGFSVLLLTKTYPANNSDTNWTRFSIPLASFVGQDIYIAWREVVADNFNEGSAILLDLVNINNTTSIISNEELPVTYSLSQNFPNPFNPFTKIKFSIAQETLVTLKVFDITGREVATLVNSPKMPGNYEVNFNAGNLSSGIYFYKLEAGDFTETKRMILVK